LGGYPDADVQIPCAETLVVSDFHATEKIADLPRPIDIDGAPAGTSPVGGTTGQADEPGFAARHLKGLRGEAEHPAGGLGVGAFGAGEVPKMGEGRPDSVRHTGLPGTCRTLR
jgi:hypothetical protein